MTESAEKVVKSYCARCKGTTNHLVEKEVRKHYTPDNTPDMEIDFADDALQIVVCRGCDEHSFRRASSCSEDWDPYTGLLEESVICYPGEQPMKRSDMLPVKPFPHLTARPRRIYRETIEAYNSELHTLAAGGLRAIVEAICIDKGITDGPVEETNRATGVTRVVRKDNLQGKISGMAERGFLTAKQADVLHEHRFMGNEALHELEMPDSESIKIAIDILEHTLVTIYELEHRGAELKAARGG